MADTFGPTQKGDRIDTLDIVRGFALLGILLMNIVIMGQPFAAYFNPAGIGEPTQAELATWTITQTFFEGSMRTLFSMLFGAGFIILLERIESRTEGLMGAKIYMRRLLLLLLFGLINTGLLAYGGDILLPYAIAGLFLLVFYKSRTRGLVVWAIILFMMTSFLNFGGSMKFAGAAARYDTIITAQSAGEELSDEQETFIEMYSDVRSDFAPTDEEIQDYYDMYEDGWWAVSGHQISQLAEMPIGFYVPFAILDPLAAMLLGMICLRVGLLQGQWPVWRIGVLTAIAFGIGLPVNYNEVQIIQSAANPIEGFFAAIPTYDLGRVTLALGWLGVILLLCKSPLFGLLKQSLGMIGRMALTNYLMASLLTSIWFIGFGHFGEYARNELYYVVAAVWAINLVFSVIWLRIFAMGPMEYLWRAGTYGTWPKLFKS